MTTRLTRDETIQALALGYCRGPNWEKRIDNDLLQAQADELRKAQERKDATYVPPSRPAYAPEGEWTLVKSWYTCQCGRTHMVDHRDPVKTTTINYRLSDTQTVENFYRNQAQIRELAAHFAGLNRGAEGVRKKPQQDVETLRVKIEVDQTELDEAVAGLFGKSEWRREGWNDAKAVMIRVINGVQRAIEHSTSNVADELSLLAGFNQEQLKKVRSFISSFVFDPEKP